MSTWALLFRPVFWGSLYRVVEKSDRQPCIWYLFTRHLVVYSESSFTNVGNDLRIYSI